MRSELTDNPPEQGLKVARTGHIAKASQSPAAHVTTTSRTLNEQGPRHTSIVRFHPLFSQIESKATNWRPAAWQDGSHQMASGPWRYCRSKRKCRGDLPRTTGTRSCGMLPI